MSQIATNLDPGARNAKNRQSKHASLEPRHIHAGGHQSQKYFIMFLFCIITIRVESPLGYKQLGNKAVRPTPITNLWDNDFAN